MRPLELFGVSQRSIHPFAVDSHGIRLCGMETKPMDCFQRFSETSGSFLTLAHGFLVLALFAVSETAFLFHLSFWVYFPTIFLLSFVENLRKICVI